MPKKAILKPGKESSLLRGHPWIFSGAIARHDDLQPGDWVEIFSHHKAFLAAGHWSDGSIAVRILTRTEEIPDIHFWEQKLENCLQSRALLGFGMDKETNTYRLVHGEGDGLPGLICDIYGSCAVLQAHSWGMWKALPQIAEALQSVFKNKLSTIFSKSKNSLHDNSISDDFLLGSETSTVARENGISFKVDWFDGQKTGFFLDQRENRKLLSQFCEGKSVLNTFSYSGGFSVFALKGGATEVTSVDVSDRAMQLAIENVNLLGKGFGKHEAVTQDTMDYLSHSDKSWDIVVLDPPAFAKNLKKKHSAVMGYKRLNALGMQHVKPGGLLFTFSCSQAVDTDLFTNTVTAAGIDAGRNARILFRLSQGPDHPVNLFHPEGSYLKGLVLQLD